MSLSWDGSGHQYVALSAGTIGAAGTGAYTMVVLIYSVSNFAGPLSLWSGSVTGTDTRDLIGDTGKWYGVNDYSATGFGSITQNAWLLISQSKAAGSNYLRWHQWAYAADGSGTKTHANNTWAISDGSAIAAVRLGDGNYYTAGNIALAAVWNRVLSDADFEALCGNTAAAFMNLSSGAPDALWLCNVANPSDVVDSTGNGASYVSTSGSGITGSAADPPSFDYSLTPASAIPAPWFKF